MLNDGGSSLRASTAAAKKFPSFLCARKKVFVVGCLVDDGNKKIIRIIDFFMDFYVWEISYLHIYPRNDNNLINYKFPPHSQHQHLN